MVRFWLWRPSRYQSKCVSYSTRDQDGIHNDCNSIDNEEIDNDGDGYVECDWDVNTWQGSTSVLGGGDWMTIRAQEVIPIPI